MGMSVFHCVCVRVQLVYVMYTTDYWQVYIQYTAIEDLSSLCDGAMNQISIKTQNTNVGFS